MNNVTELLMRIEGGDGQAASILLPMVYDELRNLAASRLKNEAPGQTLQATALVHEAYLRLVDVESPQEWDSRAHFFAAAAEAMRRILVEAARRKKSLKRGGNLSPQELVDSQIAAPGETGDVEALDEALSAFAVVDKRASEVVKLRCFAGLTLDETAAALGISRRTAARLWTYARAWLQERIE
ncbi:MAG: ECF-type sigma factor [Planctomycetaceae bacterium]